MSDYHLPGLLPRRNVVSSIYKTDKTRLPRQKNVCVFVYCRNKVFLVAVRTACGQGCTLDMIFSVQDSRNGGCGLELVILRVALCTVEAYGW
jgi:hypothetical protein